MHAAEKLDAAENQIGHAGRAGRFGMALDRGRITTSDQQLGKVVRDACKLTVEQVKGVSSQVGG